MSEATANDVKAYKPLWLVILTKIKNGIKWLVTMFYKFTFGLLFFVVSIANDVTRGYIGIVEKVREKRKYQIGKILSYILYIFVPFAWLLMPIGLIAVCATVIIGIDQVTWKNYDVDPRFNDPTMVEWTIEQKESILMDATVYALEREITTGLGYTTNDLFPLNLLDNKKYVQIGVADATKLIVEFLSLKTTNMGMGSKENIYTKDARKNSFKEDADAWMMPSAEGKYKDGIKNIRIFQEQLANGEATANISTTNLRELITLITDTVMFAPYGNITERTSEIKVKDNNMVSMKPAIPYYKVDNFVFEAIGTTLVIRDVLYVIYNAFQNQLDNQILINFQDALNSLDAAANMNPPWIENGGLMGMAMDHRSDMTRYWANALAKLTVVRDSIKD